MYRSLTTPGKAEASTWPAIVASMTRPPKAKQSPRPNVSAVWMCVDGQTLTEADVNWRWSGQQVTFLIEEYAFFVALKLGRFWINRLYSIKQSSHRRWYSGRYGNHQENREILDPIFIRWWRGTVVERRSLTGELSLSCARPAADGWPLMWVNHPLQVSQLGQLSLSSFLGR